MFRLERLNVWPNQSLGNFYQTCKSSCEIATFRENFCVIKVMHNIIWFCSHEILSREFLTQKWVVFACLRHFSLYGSHNATECHGVLYSCRSDMQRWQLSDRRLLLHVQLHTPSISSSCGKMWGEGKSCEQNTSFFPSYFPIFFKSVSWKTCICMWLPHAYILCESWIL